jgi:hypothetical protein
VFTEPLFHDLLRTCADAPVPADRASAQYLLAQERSTRILDGSSRPSVPARDFSVQEAGAGAASLRGGPDAARRYLGFDSRIWPDAGAVEQGPGAGEHAALMPTLTSQATALVSRVRSSMGTARFEARRFRIYVWAAGGAAFAYEHAVDVPNTAATMQVTGAVTLHVAFAGSVRSMAPTAGATISVAFYVDAALVGTFSVVRPAAPPGQAETSQSVRFDHAATAVVGSGTHNIELRAVGSYDQLADGQVAAWLT